MEKTDKKGHNYQVVRLLLVVLLIAGTAISGYGQVQFFTKFTTTDHWTKDDESSWNAYEGTKHYHEDGWHFSGENAIRDGSAESYNESGHSFRSRGVFEIRNTREVSMAGFRMYIRDWREEPRKARDIMLSTNGGANFEPIGTITDTFFGEDYGVDGKEYHPFEYSFSETGQTFSASDLLIKIEGHNVDEDDANQYRIRIGAFEVLGEPLSKKWSGNAETAQWGEADNWDPTGTPGGNDMVILDNTSVSGSYEVILPSGTNTVTIASLEMKPATASETITLVLPDDNTANPALELTDTWNALVLHDGAIFRNSSGASAGSGFGLTGNDGNITIRNGGRYIHNTRRVHATAIVAKLSTAEGTEKGIVEFDVPGTADYSISTSGRTYGNLVVSADAANEPRKYTSSGSSPLTIRDNLIVNNNAIFSIGMAGEVTVEQNLKIEQGGLIEFLPSAKTNISGNLTNNAGKSGLVIKSDNTSTASLIHHTSGVAATVQRHVVATDNWPESNDGWHLLSSPVTEQPISSFATSGDKGDYDFYGWDEAENLWRNRKANDWESFNGGDQFNTSQGYLVAWEQSHDFSFEGELHVANKEVTGLSRTQDNQYAGWHLLGNPFSAALTWNDGTTWQLNNISGSAQIWDREAKSYRVIQDNETIPAAQGFFVQVDEGGNGSLTIPAASRMHEPATWYKDQPFERFLLAARDLDAGGLQRTIIRFHPEATEGYDSRWDARFLAGYAPQFYSLAEGDERLAAYTLPEARQDLVIPMGFEKNTSTNFRIELKEAIPATDIYLKDYKADVMHQITADSPYDFTSLSGDDPMRFELHFQPLEGAPGIEDPGNAKNVLVWTHNNILYVETGESKATLTLYDINGREVQNFRAGAGQTSYNLQLPAGVYVLRVQSNGSLENHRIVLQ